MYNMYSRFLPTACAHRFFDEKAEKNTYNTYLFKFPLYITFVYARYCDKSCVQFSIRAGRYRGIFRT